MPTTIRDLKTRKVESVINWAHDRLNLTYDAIADVVGASKRSVLRWSKGAALPRSENEERLERLDELRFWLDEVFTEGSDEEMDRWLRSRLRALDGKTPIEVLQVGDVERVIQLLATYQTGAFV